MRVSVDFILRGRAFFCTIFFVSNFTNTLINFHIYYYFISNLVIRSVFGLTDSIYYHLRVEENFMLYHRIKKNSNGKIYDFMEFKNNRPFFTQPFKIQVENPTNETYFMVKNLVYNKKQILALRKEQDPNTIVLVEAGIENGQLMHLLMIPDEYIGDIGKMLEGSI